MAPVMSCHVGVDVGGTHTDAVVMAEGNVVISSAKHTTTADVMSGICKALVAALDKAADTLQPGKNTIMFALAVLHWYAECCQCLTLT